MSDAPEVPSEQSEQLKQESLGPLLDGAGVDAGTPQGVLDLIAAQIRDDIDAVCQVKGEDEPRRHHLGASVIGDECSRRLVYGFRWVKKEVFSGRMHRLFQRGHDEEAKIVALLRSVGFVVWEIDPNTEKQFRIYGVSGHSGGANDGVAWAPLKYKLPSRFLLEFKSHNTKSFVHLIKDRIKVAKPNHYAQMCSYGDGYKFDIGMYCAVNKNDDDLYIELVKLDHRHGQDYAHRAEDLIRSTTLPPKLSIRPDHWACGEKMCYLRGVCHFGEPYDMNCRSCKFAEPVQDGAWYCQTFKSIIPKDYLEKGCPHHQEFGRE